MTSFDWILYLKVSEMLLEQQGEEFYRSSASRAYYAVSGPVRDAIVRSNLNFNPPDKGIIKHVTIINFLKSNHRFSTMGANLGRLYRNRLRADYDSNRTFTEGDAVKSLEWAKAVQLGIPSIESS